MAYLYPRLLVSNQGRLSPPAETVPVSVWTRRNLCLRVSPDIEGPPIGVTVAGPSTRGIGIERMERREVRKGGKRFVMLWKGKDDTRVLDETLEALPDPSVLRHFCCFPDNRTVFFYLVPRKGELGEALPVLERQARACVREKES